MFNLSACAQKESTDTATPVADNFTYSEYKADNCAMETEEDCSIQFWARFIEALDAYYNLDMSEPAKFCQLSPELCENVRTTERYLSSFDTFP